MATAPWKMSVNLVLRIALGALFIWAGAAKVRDIRSFAGQIERYGLLNPIFADAAARFLPWLEIVAGVAVLTNILGRGGRLLLFWLSLLFVGVLSWAALRGLDIDCGCFGASGLSTRAALVRASALFSGCVALLFLSNGQMGVEKGLVTDLAPGVSVSQ